MDNESWFRVQHLDIGRLLAEWRWLCPGHYKLVARDAFGDLFLEENSQPILRLDVSVGKIETIANSETQFRALLSNQEKRKEWFAELDEIEAARRGLIPNENQCIAFEIPIVISAPGHSSKPYLADLYEQVSFLGDLNRQIADVPDGGQIKLIVGPRPEATKS